MFVPRNSPTMNRYFLLRFWLLVYFAAPGSFESSTDPCFCAVSSVCLPDVQVTFVVIAESFHPQAAGLVEVMTLAYSQTVFLEFTSWTEGRCVNNVD